MGREKLSSATRPRASTFGLVGDHTFKWRAHLAATLATQVAMMLPGIFNELDANDVALDVVSVEIKVCRDRRDVRWGS